MMASTTGTTQGRRKRRSNNSGCYYQLGASTLIYQESNEPTITASFARNNNNNDNDDEEAAVVEDACQIRNLLQSENRINMRWNYGLDLKHITEVEMVPPRRKRKSDTNQPNSKTLEDKEEEEEINKHQQRVSTGRLVMLLEKNNEKRHLKSHPKLLTTYQQYYDNPYVAASSKPTKDGNSSRIAEPKHKTRAVDHKKLRRSQPFRAERRDTLDPAYLAPFGLESLGECCGDAETNHDQTMKMEMPHSTAPSFQRDYQQGNCLLVTPCPCRPCSSKLGEGSTKRMASWCLFHPKGEGMDTLSVSNLILP